MTIRIGKRLIGDSKPAFIIAELSANHNQDFKLAVKTIKAMKESGADAVKLQTYTPDTITMDSRKKYFKIKHGTIWDGKSLYDLYKKAYTPWEWFPELKRIAEGLGLICFSSPFDRSAVDFLEKLNMPAYKIASYEITDIPLIEYIAAKGKPLIFSTGIAGLSDIKQAVAACKRMNNAQIAILKCTSVYPTPLKEVNLKTILDLKNRFRTVVGLSDHSLGISAAIGAVALGAKIIEKHFILDKKTSSPDAAFSLDRREFKDLVKRIREVEESLGTVTYDLTSKMKKGVDFSRSLFAVKDIWAGELLTENNVRSIRPGFGLAPKFYRNVIGGEAKLNIEKGTPLKWEMIRKRGRGC